MCELAFCLVVAQSGQDLAPWVQAVGGVTSIGFVSWLGYYFVTVLFPRTLQEFREESEKQRQHDQRRADEERASCDRRHQETQEVLRKLVDRIDRNVEISRETNHFVKDEAHARKMQRAASEQRITTQPRGGQADDYG